MRVHRFATSHNCGDLLRRQSNSSLRSDVAPPPTNSSAGARLTRETVSQSPAAGQMLAINNGVCDGAVRLAKLKPQMAHLQLDVGEGHEGHQEHEGYATVRSPTAPRTNAQRARTAILQGVCRAATGHGLSAYSRPRERFGRPGASRGGPDLNQALAIFAPSTS